MERTGSIRYFDWQHSVYQALSLTGSFWMACANVRYSRNSWNPTSMSYTLFICTSFYQSFVHGRLRQVTYHWWIFHCIYVESSILGPIIVVANQRRNLLIVMGLDCHWIRWWFVARLAPATIAFSSIKLSNLFQWKSIGNWNICVWVSRLQLRIQQDICYTVGERTVALEIIACC